MYFLKKSYKITFVQNDASSFYKKEVDYFFFYREESNYDK